jgi:tetratricopeptide (TPR) repeat protein/transglutaminase-like putative cysteine protease
LTLALALALAAQAAALPTPVEPAPSYRYESVRTHIRLEKDGFEERQIRSVVLLGSAEAVREFGQIGFPFAEGQDEVVIDEISVQKPDGRTIEPKDLLPEVVNPLGVNSLGVGPDVRIRKVTVPGLEPGDRLSARIVLRHRPITPGTTFTRLAINPLLGDPEQVVELDLPRDSPVRVRLREQLKATWEDLPARADRQVRRLRLRVPQPDYGSKGPTAAERAARQAPDLVLSSFASWDEVSRWWWALSKDRMTPDGKVREAARPAAARGTAAARLAELHALVASRVRYLNVAFGNGGMQPRAAADVLESRYGDCKDKHALLAALAQSIGIDVRPVLIHSARRDAVEDAPSPQQFDHVISVARLGDDPEGWLWMDATNNFAAAGYLVPSLRGKRALLVEPDGRGVVVRTPERPPFEPRVDVETDGVLESSGRLRGHVRWTFRSDLEMTMRHVFTVAPRDRHAQMLKAGLARSWKDDATVSQVVFSDPADLTKPFRVEFDVERAVGGQRSDRDWALWIPMPEYFLPAPDVLSTEEDGAAAALGRLEARATIRLPDGVRARAPLAVSLDRPFGRLKSEYSVGEGGLSIARSMHVDYRAAAADRAAYESFRKAVDTDRDQDFFVSALGAAAATAESLHAEGKAARSAKEYARAVDLLMQAIDRDPARVDVWNDLGLALRDAGDPQAALEAFDAEIAAHPFHETAYAERAYVLIEKLRRPDEAEPDLLRQIEVAPFKHWSYGKLGARRLHQERYEEAAQYYARAARADPQNKEYWVEQGWAQARAGQQEPARNSFAHARTLELEDWRRLRVAQGLSTIGDQALAAEIAAEALPSIEARLSKLTRQTAKLGDGYWTQRLAEGWGLVGGAALMKGDVAKADEYLSASWKAEMQPGAALMVGTLRVVQQRLREAGDWFAISSSFHGVRPPPPPPDPATRQAMTRPEGAPSGGELLMRERTVTLAPPPADDFDENVLLLVSADGAVSVARRLSARNPAACDRYLARLGRPAPGFPPLPGGPGTQIVRTALLVCSKATRCALVLDTLETRPTEDTSQKEEGGAR